VKILVVGGTGFLGGAIAKEASSAGHDVTVMSRGVRNVIMPEDIAWIQADRHGDMRELRGMPFDAVADTCAFDPLSVTSLLNRVEDIGLYALISSISVYNTYATPRLDEDSPTSRATEAQWSELRNAPHGARGDAESMGEAYGPMKREAELAALERLGSRALILRAGLLIGAGDYTDRMTYWVRHIDQAKRVAAPGSPERPVQFIDVRDAAKFIVSRIEDRAGGIFNLTGSADQFGNVLETIRAVACSEAVIEWVDEGQILSAGIEPWTEFPVWLPDSDMEFRNFLNVSVDLALQAGLELRPFEDTVADILEWDRQRRHLPLKVGLSPEQEARLLDRR
jgi:2'-hydroxyisoflavone reductase